MNEIKTKKIIFICNVSNCLKCLFYSIIIILIIINIKIDYNLEKN